MADNINVSLVITAIDKATAPLRGVAAALGGIAKSFSFGIGAGAGMAAFEGLSRLASTVTSLPGSIIDVSAKFERMTVSLEALEGGADGAKKAMDWIVEFAKTTPLEIDDVTEAYTQLKAFGLDPTSGVMQALTDQMAKHGKSAEWLSGVVLQMGQAWTKGKLQGDDLKSLLSSGIPVYDMLAKVTGKTVAEVTEMASKGKVTRDVMKKLFTEMAKDAEGASAAQAKTFGGLTSMISDTWTQFQRKIGDAGFFDAIKGKLSAFNDLLDQMAASGSLDRLAKEIGETLANAVDWCGRAVMALWQALSQWADPTGRATNAAQVLTMAGEKLAVVLGDIGSALAGVGTFMVNVGNTAQWLGEKFGWLINVGSAFNQMNTKIWEGWSAVGKGIGSLFGGGSPAAGKEAASAPSALAPATNQQSAATVARSAAEIAGKGAAANNTSVGGGITVTVKPEKGAQAKLSDLWSSNPAVPLTLKQGLSMGGF